MALTSMDALGAFSHLQTNLPTWVTRVSELAAHTSAKHAEYTEAYRRYASFKPRRRKNSSVRSIHPENLVPIAEQQSPSPEVVEAVETVETTQAVDSANSNTNNFTPMQQVGRKRGPDEAISIDSCERYAYVSTRHNVTIEYDGHTQKALEEIVKEIGIARNNIRRGKMSAMPHAGLRAGLLNRTANLTSNQTQGEESPLAGLTSVRSARLSASLGSAAGPVEANKESSFNLADKQLELAYGLCETAAYQALRCGDCGTELDGVQKRLKDLMELVDTEVARLTEEKKQQQEIHETKATEEEPSKPPLTPTAARLARLAAISAAAKKPAATTPTTTVAGAIEVDDGSSISVESLDLSAFRSSQIRV